MPSKKQLAARAKFAYIMKHGGFKKSKKQGSKQIRRKSQKSKLKRLRVLKSGIRQSKRILSNPKLSRVHESESNLLKVLEKALNDKTVKSITIKK